MGQKLPPLNALRTFDAAAQTGSFKGAAELLNVTQSAVSHQINYLEGYLGILLLSRNARAIELSCAGRACLQMGYWQVESDPALATLREAGHEAPSSRIN